MNSTIACKQRWNFLDIKRKQYKKVKYTILQCTLLFLQNATAQNTVSNHTHPRWFSSSIYIEFNIGRKRIFSNRMHPSGTQPLCRTRKTHERTHTHIYCIVLSTLYNCRSTSLRRCRRFLMSVWKPSTSSARLRSKSWYRTFMSSRRFVILWLRSCTENSIKVTVLVTSKGTELQGLWKFQFLLQINFHHCLCETAWSSTRLTYWLIISFLRQKDKSMLQQCSERSSIFKMLKFCY